MPTDPRYDCALRGPRLLEPVDRSLVQDSIETDVRLGMYRELHELRQFGKPTHDLFLQNLVKARPRSRGIT